MNNADNLLLGSAPAGYSIISLALLILYLAAQWRVFTKAGEPGWKSLIPIYSAYTYFRIGWQTYPFWVILGGTVAVNLLVRLADWTGIGLILAGFAAIAWSIYALVVSVKLQIRTAHRFGKSTAFGVIGLWLFSFIGMAILAWGSADYNAARDTGDGVLHMDAAPSGDDPYGKDFWDRYSRTH